MRFTNRFGVLTIALALSACGGKGSESGQGGQGSPDAQSSANDAKSPAEDEPATVVSTPPVLRPASEAKSSPFVEPADDSELAARAAMNEVVQKHALDPDNAWAVAHALIVLGPETKLADGRLAVDVMFERWAETETVEGQALASFPAMKGKVPVEPHPGLMLKSIAEAGVDPTHEVSLADGTKVPVSTLFLLAAHQTYASDGEVSPGKWNDTPWLLQGLATWAPEDFAWIAKGGHRTDMNALTHALSEQLQRDTKFLHDAIASGATVQKRKQGIFAYTCGGQHFIQGVGYATARGFGEDGDRAAMAVQIDALLFRIDIELSAVDQLLVQAPEYRDKLLAQRLKFLGHTLETVHKFAALGLVELDDAKKERLRYVRGEIVKTVQSIQSAGLFDQLETVRGKDYQLFLDLVGDSAHALRGFAMADGSGSIAI